MRSEPFTEAVPSPSTNPATLMDAPSPRLSAASAKRAAVRILLLTLLLGHLGSLPQARAQVPQANAYYHPLHARMPTDQVAQWMRITGRAQPWVMQPVRITLPEAGRVWFFPGPEVMPLETEAPAQVALAVGRTYRIRLSHLADHPGIELYPTIELIGRLHPPAELAERFPIPIPFTSDEIDAAVEGRLVTKVIYLEQPQLADPRPTQHPVRVTDLPPQRDLLAEADRRGRPLVIVRMGGRLPSAHTDPEAFFGPPAPVIVLNQKTEGEQGSP